MIPLSLSETDEPRCRMASMRQRITQLEAEKTKLLDQLDIATGDSAASRKSAPRFTQKRSGNCRRMPCPLRGTNSAIRIGSASIPVASLATIWERYQVSGCG
jgi:hypothetical protein